MLKNLYFQGFLLKIAIGVFLFFSLLHSRPNLDLTNEESVWLSLNPVLRLGFDSSRPPYDFSDESGLHKGILSSYYDYFKTILGVDFIVVQADSWSELMHLVRQGEVDIVSGLIKNPQREEYLNFSAPIFSVPLSVVASKDSLIFVGLESFENKRVAMVTSHGAIEIIKKAYPHISIITHDNLVDAFTALEDGLLDAIIGETYSLKSHLLARNVRDYHIAHTLPESYTLHIGTNKSLPHLHNILEKTLKMVDFETKQHFHQSWLYCCKPPFFKIWHGFFLAFIAFAGSALIALKNRHLAKELITVVKNRDNALAHLDIISKSLNAGIWTWHINKDKYIFDSTFANTLGYDESEITPTFDGFMSLVSREDRPSVIAALKRHIEKIDPFYSVYCKLIHKNGHSQMFHSFGGILASDKYNLPTILGGCHILLQTNNLKPKNNLIDDSTGLLSQHCYHSFVPIFLKQARRECFGVSLVLFRLSAKKTALSSKDQSLREFGVFVFESILVPSGFVFYMGNNIFCTIFWCDNPEDSHLFVKKIQDKSSCFLYEKSLRLSHGGAFMLAGSYVDEATLYKRAYADLSEDLQHSFEYL